MRHHSSDSLVGKLIVNGSWSVAHGEHAAWTMFNETLTIHSSTHLCIGWTFYVLVVGMSRMNWINIEVTCQWNRSGMRAKPMWHRSVIKATSNRIQCEIEEEWRRRLGDIDEEVNPLGPGHGITRHRHGTVPKPIQNGICFGVPQQWRTCENIMILTDQSNQIDIEAK